MILEESNGVLLLNPDVEIVSVREFPLDVRERLGGNASDFILSDRTSRIASQRINQEVAMFLRRFREPRRIVEAVFQHSTELQREPSQVLSEIYPLITRLRLGTILLDPKTVHRRPLGPTLTPGDWFEGYRVIECASGLAETDVYKAESADGSLVAIKYLRSGSDEAVRDNLRREIAVLQHANARGCAFTPRLYATNAERDDPYVCLEWFDGQTLFDLNRWRQCNISQRAGVVASLADAYVGLHQSGVLHGDIHPCNVLILADGGVRLIDFGGARLIDQEDTHARIGLVHYYEPEVARTVLAGQPPALPSLHGEQYCIAGLAYSVITRGSCLALSLETETALSQIASQPPRRFEELGVTWPAVEKVLSRALNKYPVDRYATLAEFRDALLEALATGIPPQQPSLAPQTARPVTEGTNQLEALNRYVRHFTECHGLAANVSRAGLSRGPKASLYAGSAGIAYALLRVGCLHQDAEVLAAADVWISHALGQRNDTMAFTDGSIGAATETGPLALFHSVTGLHTVNALIRYASGDTSETRQAMMAFIQSVPAEALDSTLSASILQSFPQDATNGAASVLLGAALLLPLCGPSDGGIRLKLEVLARGLCAIVQRQFDPAKRENRFLGFAHGRSGAIYSLLRWADVSGTPPVAPVSRYLDELASFARRTGDGLAWPIEIGNPGSPAWTGWCHGSAGHLLTWTIAARMLQRPDYLEFAMSAGRNIWELKGQSGPSLCCGGAGEALSLFELARACGDQLWIDRGLQVVTHAVDTSSYTNDAQGLFRAEAGIALTAAEAIEPMRSVWPICQSPL